MSDINEFLKSLQKEPATPEPKATRASRYREREEKKREIKQNWTKETLGIDPVEHTIRTNLKRVVFNETGITEAINQITSLPEPGWAVHTIMGGAFNGFDIIPAIHRMTGQPLEHLHIATLGFNLRNNKNLCQMIDDGQIQAPVTLIASEVFTQMDANVYLQAKENLVSRGCRIASTRNHAKIITCRVGQNWITTESSGNLRSCSSIEQLTIINDETVARFHMRWIDQIATQAPS